MLDRRAELRVADSASVREPVTAEETQTGPDGHHDHTRGTDNGTEPGEGSVPISERVMAASQTTSLGPNQERSEEHTSELQSRGELVCRLLLEKKKGQKQE